MCDSRALHLKQLDLETIEEEEGDLLSQNSRVQLKSLNGADNREKLYPQPLSQTNTITTYDTQRSAFFDLSSLAYQNVNNGGSGRTSLHRQIALGGFGTYPCFGRGANKWDRNYYFNDYDTKDPLSLYEYSNPKARGHSTTRKSGCNMDKLVSWCWCGSSVRYFILFLSFLAVTSLYANLQLYNLVALYTEDDLLPAYLRDHNDIIKKLDKHQTVNWGITPTGNGTELKREVSNGGGQKEAKNEFGADLTKNDKNLDGMKNADNANGTMKSELDHSTRSTMGGKDRFGNVTNGNTTLANGIAPRDRCLLGLFGQSIIFSVPGMAMMLGHFPSILLLRRFGSAKVVFGALLLSGAVTAAFPFLLKSGPLLIVLVRFLHGLCFSIAFAFIGINATRWATVKEQLFFTIFGFLAIEFAPALSWSSTIFLIRSNDHYSRVRLFGAHTAVSTLLAIIWLLFYRDHPHKHSAINGEELNKIFDKKPSRNRHPTLPRSLRCMILRSTSVWAVWVASFCYFFAILALHIFLPTFMFHVLQQPIDHTIALPFATLFVVHLFVHMLGACFGESKTWKVRTFNAAAFLLSAILFIGVAIIPPGDFYASKCVLFLWNCLLPLGICSAGFIKSAVVCGQYFSKNIVAQMQLIFGLAYFLIPTFVFIVPSESGNVHWRLLFLSTALLLLLGLAVFAILGRGTPMGWAESWVEQARGEDPLLMVKFTPTGGQI